MNKEKMSFSIIGASALGMPALNLIIRYFPIKEVVLIDPDKWEQGQLYKHIVSQKRHVGISKVKAAQQIIKAYNPKINVTSLLLKAQQPKARKAMLKTKYWIVCVDNDETRLDLQILAAQHQKTMLDLSAQIVGKERIGTIRLYVPKKTACIVCQGLPLQNIMTDTLREAKEKTGYLTPGSNENPRSVAILDTATATIGTSLLIDYLEEKKNLPTTISYNQTKHAITKISFKKGRSCKICKLPKKEKLCHR